MTDETEKEILKVLEETLNVSLQTAVVLSRVVDGLESNKDFKVKYGDDLKKLIKSWREYVTSVQDQYRIKEEA